jgi:hypothetical protein
MIDRGAAARRVYVPEGESMTTSTHADTLERPDGRVVIREVAGGRREVAVEPADSTRFVSRTSCVTRRTTTAPG